LNEDAKPLESSYVLDTSALLTVVLNEPGAEAVEELLRSGACISSVNTSEALTRFLDNGFTVMDAENAINEVECLTVDFTHDHAYGAGRLRPATRAFGPGIGDRACLALATALTLPAVTADRIWRQLDIGVEVVVCR
jgi:ribonuclease VapC